MKETDVKIKNIEVGKTYRGTVIHVTDKEVLVDVGYFLDAVMYKDHVTKKHKNQNLKDLLHEGDKINVKITKIGEESLYCSCLDLEEQRERDEILASIKNKEPFEAQVIKNTKNGLILKKDSLELLLPTNLVDLNKEFDPNTLVGQTVRVIYKGLNENKRIIVDRKSLQYLELKQATLDEKNSIVVGEDYEVTVIRVAKFGAFVKFKYNEGLIHFVDLSHYKIKEVTDVVNVGDVVKAKVIRNDEKKIALSLKALQEKPWDLFAKEHKVGDKIEGTIVKKMQFGMLCEVARDVVGIINRDDYSWDPSVNLAGMVEEGDKLEVQITYMDAARQKMTLSKKHLEYNPWNDISLHVGDIVSGSVLRYTNTGAIVKIGSVEGFLHNKEIKEGITKAEEALKIDEVVQVEVLKVDPRAWKLSLSMLSIQRRKDRETYEKFLKENVSGSSTVIEKVEDK